MLDFRQVSRFNRFMCWLLLSCTIMSLLPQSLFTGSFGQWLHNYRLLFILGMVASGAYFFSHAAIMLFQYVFSRKQRAMQEKLLKELLDYLDANEKSVLREFVIQRKSVIKLPVTEPAVKNLLEQGILTYAYGEPGEMGLNAIKPLMISIEARPLLTFKVLGINPSSMTEEQKDLILNTRPKYAYKQLDRH
ncbi:superinfection exclusion B family protein [Oceanisphaera pacifica]|uniref:Superinfection exclusion B family protein n=1 Tax=Oceanisphaera pacifica TaxID=2818389 RepID=A0ABS3NCG4_9GAMM|nr:superinfection exclusion B family protein [Oceanisphaera pacifica]MBO1518276.1 superinfection exclusion B family protein [Oceanisphaera pacifica]